MRTHHALQPRTPEPVYEGTVVEDADDWRLTAVLALAPMTLAFAYLIVMLFFVFL